MPRVGPSFRSERPARAWRALVALAAWALLAAAPGAAWAVLNEIDDVPAATLLLPYFEVDLDDPASGAVPGPSDVQGWVDVLHDPGGRHSVLQRPAHLSVAGP